MRLIVAAVLAVSVIGCAEAADYPAMAPLAQYQMNPTEEAALARSAAPAAISDRAEIMVMGSHGYETVAKGTNGFVCMVQRAWANNFDAPDFWNPRGRAPICYNPAAARTVVPPYLKRTEWVLAGVPKAEMKARNAAAIAAKTFGPPDPGAMCFMMSKRAYLADDDPHWRPHLMHFVPPTTAAQWGANVPGSPVIGGGAGDDPYSTFLTPVPAWSDGTPGPAMPMAM
jgi:hypothetical protein